MWILFWTAVESGSYHLSVVTVIKCYHFEIKLQAQVLNSLVATCTLKVYQVLCLNEHQCCFSVLLCQYLDSSSGVLHRGDKRAVSALSCTLLCTWISWFLYHEYISSEFCKEFNRIIYDLQNLCHRVQFDACTVLYHLTKVFVLVVWFR